MANILARYLQVFARAKPYSLYALFILLITYMFNQLDRYALSITSVEIAQALKYGDRACMKLSNQTKEAGKLCTGLNETMCDQVYLNETHQRVCKFDYNGQGAAYQIVAGPIFILVFTFTGILLSIFADNFQNKRVVMLSGCLIWWSTMTALTGLAKEYWQLAILRFGLGFGEAGCNPMASSLIAEYFELELRGAALGIYNWGIYTGYSLSFAIGNQILKYLDWQWVFYISGLPGILLGVIVLLTLKQPKPAPSANPTQSSNDNQGQIQAQPAAVSNAQKLKMVIKEFLKPSIILICIAGSIRNAAGYVWAYNNNSYYRFLNQTPDQISSYLGTIPIFAGIVGSFLGGFVSDRVANNAKPWNRIWVLVLSQLLAAPFVFCVLLFDPPYSYYFLIPTYIIGEMWVGVCLTVLIELVPTHLRTTGIGFYFFVIGNIGGNMQVLVPPVQAWLRRSFKLSEIQAFRGVLYIFYPGEYILGSLLFLLTLFVLKRDLSKLQQERTLLEETPSDAQNPVEPPPDENRGLNNPNYQDDEDHEVDLPNRSHDNEDDSPEE